MKRSSSVALIKAEGRSSSDPSSPSTTPWQEAVIERSALQTAFKEKIWITN
ncbi:MAG: hypothetical protein JRF60_02620 [Deltaproteobacteria bacterium]|nr:hypothetical protein [Deltaproteobacteria bacterium]